MASTSYTGIGIVKIFFQLGTNMSIANAQVTSIAQTVLKQMPPGMTPPLVMNYNAATVPIIQLAMSAQGMTEQARVRSRDQHGAHAAGHGAGCGDPFPFGGKFRQIQIDLDLPAMQARGLSANDVANALVAQNIPTPAGTQKIGAVEYLHQLQQRGS